MSVEKQTSVNWRLVWVLSACVGRIEATVDWCITNCGPLYIATAAVLIGTVTVVFFAAIVPEVLGRQGAVHACCHSVFGMVLLSNVAFHYVMTIRTAPGCSADLPEQVLMDATEQAHWCHRCQLPKPNHSHHCHICDKCILRMDHHCPWMDTCIGFANIRYFILTLFWLFIGAAYAAVMSFRRLRIAVAFEPATPEAFFDETLWLIFVCILGAAMTVAIGLLLMLNVYLIATSQSTIDLHAAFDNRHSQSSNLPLKIRKSKGLRGAVQNFQDVFDVQGKLWWLKWLVPNLNPKRGLS